MKRNGKIQRETLSTDVIYADFSDNSFQLSNMEILEIGSLNGSEEQLESSITLTSHRPANSTPILFLHGGFVNSNYFGLQMYCHGLSWTRLKFNINFPNELCSYDFRSNTSHRS
jgi:hypothetical protein